MYICIATVLDPGLYYYSVSELVNIFYINYTVVKCSNPISAIIAMLSVPTIYVVYLAVVLIW